jgi:hypothetical protein
VHYVTPVKDAPNYLPRYFEHEHGSCPESWCS